MEKTLIICSIFLFINKLLNIPVAGKVFKYKMKEKEI